MTERGVTAQRIFVYDPADTTHDEEVPDIGDVFLARLVLDEETMTGLVCRSRSESCVNADKRIVQWTCNYSNEPCDMSAFQPDDELPSDLANLPMTLEYSGEFVNIRPANDASTVWVWEDQPTVKVTDPISFKVVNITLRIKRWVKDINFNIFNENIRHCTSTVNNVASPFPIMGGGIGCWLFSSATSEFYRDHNDAKIWQAELLFTYRDPDGTDANGWNKILRSDGDWAVPMKSSDSSYMYTQSTFGVLFGNTMWDA